MAAALVTLAQAKEHLRITLPAGDPGDADIQLKLDAAEALIRKYLKAQDDPTWTAVTVPPPIQQAILITLTEFFENRGDNQERNTDFWSSIERLLSLYRDPALA